MTRKYIYGEISLVFMFAAAFFSHIWQIAQTTTPSGTSSQDITNVLTLVTQIGLSAIFLWQWRDERRERRELQTKMVDWIERFGPVLEASTTTLARVQAVMAEQVDQAALHRDTQFSDAVAQLGRTANDLKHIMDISPPDKGGS